MKKLTVLPELTKKYILERVTQEEIMNFYIGVPVNKDTLIGNSFLSPVREDNNPTCNYYYYTDKKGETRLKLSDWNGTLNGDIFDIASCITKINTKNSQGFKLLLHKIASDFLIHKYSDSKERQILENTVNLHLKTAELKVFKVIPRNWNDFDKQYWYDKFDIGSDLLRLGKVIPVQILEIEGKDGYLHPVYKYFAKDPAYAYYGGVINGVTIWKVYFPFRKRGSRRFLTNYAFIQGLDILQCARVCLITKSLKDVLCYKRFGIEAVAVPSETYLMTKDEFFSIKCKFDIVLTNFDYDTAGILLANKYKKVHKCLPLMFTRGKFNQIDFGVKDFSEFREAFGRERTISLIEQILSPYLKDIESINKYNYESLKWIQ